MWSMGKLAIKTNITGYINYIHVQTSILLNLYFISKSINIYFDFVIFILQF